MTEDLTFSNKDNLQQKMLAICYACRSLAH